MRKFCFYFGVLLLFSVSAVEISDLVVRQRWPFSEKVDVDYTLTGVSSDVAFTATWAGQTSPSPLGVALAAKPGRNRFTWDPASSALANQTLADFRVTATPVSSEPRTYLIVDLLNGGYSFTNAAPATASGWNYAHKGNYLVFRRVPAGIYTNGIAEADVRYLNEGALPYAASNWTERVVTLDADRFVSVYPLTVNQYCRILGESGPGSSGYKPQLVSYEALRGTNFVFSSTGFAVATNSPLANLRAKVGGDLVVDLCEDELWEIAARAGTRTYWPNGGTASETNEELRTLVNEIAVWKGGGDGALKEVGKKSANPWGFYDLVGNYAEMTLAPSVYRSYIWNTTLLWQMLPACRWTSTPSLNLAVRLAIYPGASCR